MLTDWITRKGVEEERPDADVALAELREIVSSVSESDIPGLVAELTSDRFGALVETPLHDQDATELLARIIDRLGPDQEQSEILERRFPLRWSMSVMGGEGFEPRPLLNGALLVRNMHRVLGPAMWDGVILDMSPELAETLQADLETLRGRNTDGDPSCFLFAHDERGATGDNRNGDGHGHGDDEQIRVDLSRVPSGIRRLAITVTIHEAETRGQSFGQVSNAFIRVVNEETGAELVRYDLSEAYSTETAMIFGELYRHNSEWKFRAVGQGYRGRSRRHVCPVRDHPVTEFFVAVVGR